MQAGSTGFYRQPGIPGAPQLSTQLGTAESHTFKFWVQFRIPLWDPKGIMNKILSKLVTDEELALNKTLVFFSHIPVNAVRIFVCF